MGAFFFFVVSEAGIWGVVGDAVFIDEADEVGTALFEGLSLFGELDINSFEGCEGLDLVHFAELGVGRDDPDVFFEKPVGGEPSGDVFGFELEGEFRDAEVA